MKNPANEHILSHCRHVSRRYLLNGLAVSALNALALAVCLISAAAVFEAVLYLPSSIKTLILYAIPLCVILSFLLQAAFAVFRRPDETGSARMIETAFPSLGDRLISAVQLGSISDDSLRGQSGELVRALLASVDSELKVIDITKVVRKDRLIRSFHFVTASMILFLGFGIVFPDILLGGVYRIADNTRTYYPPDRTEIHLTHSPATVIRGEDYEIAGFVAGSVPEKAELYFRWDDSASWRMKPVELTGMSGAFNGIVEKPRYSFSYYLEAEDVATSQNRVTVIERPDVDGIAVTLDYPSYTGKERDVLTDHDGNIRALRGTNATFRITANKILSKMTLVFGDDTSLACDISGNTGLVTFTIGESSDYHIALLDTLGITNIDPITYRITSLEDEYPSVTILSPPGGSVIPRALTVPVVYTAGDDYGITAVSLVYTLPYEEKGKKIPLETGGSGTDLTKEYPWDLSGYNLLPDDTVSYFLEVYDNDTVAGPKRSVSETATLRMPSLTDILNGVNEKQQEGIDTLRDFSERSDERDRKLDDISRDIKSRKKFDWSDKTAVGEAKEDLEKMRREMKDVAESVGDVAEQLSEDDIAALETVDKLQKISDLMNGIADKDMRQALEQLTRAKISLDPKEVEKALSEYTVTSEEIAKKLDRIIKLLEQVQSLQRFETAKRMLEDMAVKQAELAQKFNDDPSESRLAREEAALSREMESLQEEIEESIQEIGEQFEMDTDQAQQAIQKHDPAASMSEASQQMKDNRPSEAQESLDKANTGISGLLNEMDMLSAMMESKNTAEIKKRLFASLDELLVISAGQENLLDNESKETSMELAERQMALISAFSKAEKSLQSLGEVVVELAGVIDQITTSTRMTMESTLNGYTIGNKKMGNTNAAHSLGMLNSSIHFLTTIMQQSQGMSSEGMMPGDLMQQLQNIADGQLQLQQQMGPGMMDRLAAEQDALARMLSNLNEKLSQDRRLQEMLEQLAREMDETSEMMRRNQPRERVERKQLDIYRRLLDARRSRRRKDEPEGRKSWTAKQNISKGAERLSQDRGERHRDIHERIERAMQDGFDPAYRELIRGYFESLMETDRPVEGGE